MRTHTPTHSVANSDRSITHVKALDGMRGLAILLVVVHHAMSIPMESKDAVIQLASRFTSVGWTGVDLFFVLSGFLITSILLANQGKKNWLTSFYARRALRVLPLYYLILVVCFWIIPSLSINGTQWLSSLGQDQLWYWLHGANFRRIDSHINPFIPTVGWFSTFWSLSIEEQFYLFWPIVVLVAKKELARVCLLGVLVVTCIRWFSGIFGSDLLTYFHTFTRLDGLLLGSSIAAYVSSGGDLERLKKLSKLILVISIAAFSLPLLINLQTFGRSTVYGQLFLYSASSWGSTAILVLALVATSGSKFRKLMESKFFGQLGKYSFGMYVLNKPILAGISSLMGMYGLKLTGLELIPVLIASCVMCFAAAWLSWILVERPALTLKRFFPVGDRSKSQEKAEDILLKSAGRNWALRVRQA